MQVSFRWIEQDLSKHLADVCRRSNSMQAEHQQDVLNVTVEVGPRQKEIIKKSPR